VSQRDIQCTPCFPTEKKATVAAEKRLTSTRFDDRETVLISTVFNLNQQTFRQPQISRRTTNSTTKLTNLLHSLDSHYHCSAEEALLLTTSGVARKFFSGVAKFGDLGDRSPQKLTTS